MRRVFSILYQRQIIPPTKPCVALCNALCKSNKKFKPVNKIYLVTGCSPGFHVS